MVDGVTSVGGQIEICKACIHGKQHRLPFPPSNKHARHKLDLIHSDVCGPFPNNIGGKCYFITFVDDHTQKGWIFFMAKKSEAYTMFRKFKELVETATGLKIRVFCTDGGGEYTSFEFEGYLESCGIFHKKTAPHTPEQNGLTEIMNHIIIECSRCMIFEGNLSSGFWTYAFDCAIYLMNCSPVSHLPDSAPEEAWSETKPIISSFQAFSCPAYAHIPKANHTKLAWKTRKCIMLGYEVGTTAY